MLRVFTQQIFGLKLLFWALLFPDDTRLTRFSNILAAHKITTNVSHIRTSNCKRCAVLLSDQMSITLATYRLTLVVCLFAQRINRINSRRHCDHGSFISNQVRN